MISHTTLLLLTLLLLGLSAFTAAEDVNERDYDYGVIGEGGEEGTEVAHPSDREGKIFVSTFHVLPNPCDANMNNISMKGVCLTNVECRKRQGIVDGECIQNMAVCCILKKSCDLTTNNNHTFFTNPNYPDYDDGYGACSLTVKTMNSDICQVRVDFLELEMSQPDANGDCVGDFLTITGGISSAPIICGSNSGQHLYVDIDRNGATVKLTVDRTAVPGSDRIWNVKVTQVACTSAFRAPRGCLQYFTSTSGLVSSFNYDSIVDARSAPLVTRQISRMDYSVCIQMAEGYCSIMWYPDVLAEEYSFTVSHTVDGMDPAILGTPSASTTGSNCTSDYVLIPGGTDDAGISNDRYCGTGFPNSVKSSMAPFLLFVKTDEDEKTDTLNRGFSLRYRQLIC